MHEDARGGAADCMAPGLEGPRGVANEEGAGAASQPSASMKLVPAMLQRRRATAAAEPRRGAWDPDGPVSDE
jgi:hypothetical protein